MTNRIAIGLGLFLGLLLALNFLLGLDAHIFAARRFVALIEWLAFWR